MKDRIIDYILAHDTQGKYLLRVGLILILLVWLAYAAMHI